MTTAHWAQVSEVWSVFCIVATVFVVCSVVIVTVLGSAAKPAGTTSVQVDGPPLVSVQATAARAHASLLCWLAGHRMDAFVTWTWTGPVDEIVSSRPTK